MRSAIGKRFALLEAKAIHIAEINFLPKDQLAKKIQNLKTNCKPELKEFWREYLEKMEQRLADLDSQKSNA